MQIDFIPDPALYPFVSRWFEGSVGRIHYIDEGEGRPILFLHGNPTWSFLYRKIIKELREDFRCIAVDYPGFGLSDRPKNYGYTPAEHASAVTTLLAHLDLDDLIVMGQDWGGPIGMACALAMPQRVTGLVFGNTWFWPTDRRAYRAFSILMSSPWMRRRVLHGNIFVERLMPLGVANRLSPEVMAHYRGVQASPAARVGVAEFPRQLIAARPWFAGLATTVPQVLADRPLLLVWGMKDQAFPARGYLRRWQTTFDDVTTVTLPAAKHFIQEDAPGEIVDAIRSRFG